MKFTTEKIIKLLQVRGLGKGRVIKLSDMLPSLISDDVLLADFILENIHTLKIPTINKEDLLRSFAKGRELYEISLEKNIKIISINEREYPEKLKRTNNPPLLINVLGNLEALNSKPSFAVIGTREPSTYGKQIGERIGYLLGENNINVVSGLAIGCDTAAHIGCLRAGGVTTAVLAHGLDSIYPKENSSLAQAILDNNGCLVSEYLIKTRGQPNFFVERDRIQAGLSDGTFVVETDIKGGTMHTVAFAKEYKRILAAFEHPADKRNDKSRGNEKLISDGDAMKIKSQEDINDLIRNISPVPLIAPLAQVNSTSLETFQLPAFDIDMLIDKEYHLAQKPKRKKAAAKLKKETNIIQSKLDDEWE
jgi:DNA processing protein